MSSLDAFASLLDRCAEAGRQLSQAVAGTDTGAIDAATQALGQYVLEVQRTLPQLAPAIESLPADLRAAWREQLAQALQPIKVGTEISTLQAAAASARLAALARLSGADMAYTGTGQLSR
ncbi:hypothetical protein PIGHUM_01972 [Pigmentiphaga humi]|uniref:Uncharacterized protein n=1 Tax=Pigmentiphaga humi TaxID=2478468 RepID=A0A3P4B0S9_9BURK|nr:hypothetical protein [Pigmentiphaga humi]VCU69907.1 hypothetical protein PIGHUM_01972 [Pigmentiphaga humi]